MGIIEDQKQEIREELNRQRRAVREAEAQRNLYLWSKQNPTWACEANLQILSGYLNQAGIQVTEEALDLALRATRNNLAEKVPTPVVPDLTAEEKRTAENERLKSLSREALRAEIKAGIAAKLATPEYGGYGSTYVPPFTAAEFKQFSPTRVKEIMHYPDSNQERPGVRAGIDKLLREAQLLKDATKSNQ